MKTETIFAIISAVGIIGGILAWFLSRLLDDRLDAKESKMEIAFLKERFTTMENRLEKIERWYTNDRGN